jgi:hypothetical protein
LIAVVRAPQPGQNQPAGPRIRYFRCEKCAQVQAVDE